MFIKPKTTLFFGKIEELTSIIQTKRAVIITDTNVEKLYSRNLSILKNEEFDAVFISFPAGEVYKTRATKENIENRMLKDGCGRDTTVIAIGGGVVTDLAGFVAATYCRGVPLISVPTTLLAMVDASIGGKVAVDVPEGKNLIGAFYPPSHILIDERFLKTLPEKEWQNGFSEILKYGLVRSKKLLEKNMPLDKLISSSIKVKKTIVEKDPKENGIRRILNFGHTFGHAFEMALSIDHGQAVAMGMLFESYLSFKMGYLKHSEFEKISSLLKQPIFKDGLNKSLVRSYFPFWRKYNFSNSLTYKKLGEFCKIDFLSKIKIISNQALIQPILKRQQFDSIYKLMCMDKKSVCSEPRFVILNAIGGVEPFNGEYCTRVNPGLIEEVYNYFSC